MPKRTTSFFEFFSIKLGNALLSRKYKKMKISHKNTKIFESANDEIDIFEVAMKSRFFENFQQNMRKIHCQSKFSWLAGQMRIVTYTVFQINYHISFFIDTNKGVYAKPGMHPEIFQ